ncbi:hypothetical protein GCM10007862_29410 [Dyella lipolytica]|uniref:Uncharacterized protein n=1 Tax=Dyella lipolytica TaxID=1867835 RepID=A0ABW8IVN2_9GAMM|nr:hypothetical protein [Dyella lipolytica]GLQ47890.1 hypothetical protein GCM10007862_29410 [Dyella lipolytica]
MRAIPLLLGCLLSVGAIANATATGTKAAGGISATSAYNCTDQSAGHATSHDTTSANGDALNIPRAGSTAGSSGSIHASSPRSSTEDSPAHAAADALPGNTSHGSSGLGWQSLLPGSIQ